MRSRILIFVTFIALLLQASYSWAGTDGKETLKKTSSSGKYTANECFEGVSRGIFNFNQGLDKAIFKPIAKGYRALPVPIRKGSSNVIDNLRSLLSLSNDLLQGNFRNAGNTAGRFVINSTVGVLGIWDPALSFGMEKNTREDFGQTLGAWGVESGCYFVLPILGPTTVRDTAGLIGNTLIDPIYQITHNTEVMDRSYSEHNYYYYRGADGVDFRAKNIESFDSLERNSIDLYASVKSLYLQNRKQRIENSDSIVDTQSESDWEEIDIK